MKCPDCLAPKLHHVVWFLAGNAAFACALLVLGTVPFTGCCVPQARACAPTPAEEIRQQIHRIERSLDAKAVAKGQE